MAERERVRIAYPIVERERGVPVGILLLAVLVGLFSCRLFGHTFSKPVVFVHGRVYVGREIMVVVGCGRYVQSLYEQVFFAVFCGRHEGMPVAVLFAEYYLLIHSVLYFFVEVRIGKAEHQAVGPRLVGYAYLSDDRFVMERVVETLYPVNGILVADGRVVFVVELFYPIVDVVVVVRVVLKRVDFVSESVFEALPEVDV